MRNPSINHTGHGKYDVDIIRKPNQKIFGQRMYQDRRKNNSTCHHRIKTWILRFTNFKKKESKNFVVLGQQWKNNINAQVNPGIIIK